MRRSRRARLADLLVVLFVALFAVAIGVNSVADTRDLNRTKLDNHVFHRYLASHPALGRYGPTTVKVHKRLDMVCAYKRHVAGRPGQGFCMQVVSHPDSSEAIAYAYSCVQIPNPTRAIPHPGRPPLPPGALYCPSHG